MIQIVGIVSKIFCDMLYCHSNFVNQMSFDIFFSCARNKPFFALSVEYMNVTATLSVIQFQVLKCRVEMKVEREKFQEMNKCALCIRTKTNRINKLTINDDEKTRNFQ